MCKDDKMLIISDSDLDGIGAIVVAKTIFPNIEYITPERNLINETVKDVINSGKYNTIFMTDCSISDEDVELIVCEFVSKGNKFVLLDHHKSAIHLNKYEWSKIKVETDGFKHSGTELMFSHLKELGYNMDALAEFSEMVRCYDTWDWANLNKPEPERLNVLYWNYEEKELFVQNMVNRISKGLPLINEKDNAVIDTIKNLDKKYIEERKEMFSIKYYDKYKVAVLFTDRCVSQLGNIICKENEDIDFCCLVDLNRSKISMRCVKDSVDVSEIAKRFNGGGHAKAAGFVLADGMKDNVVSLIF